MKFLKSVKCNLHVKNTRNFGGWASQTWHFQKNYVLRYYFQKNHVLPSFKTAILTVFPRKHSCFTLSIYIFKNDSSKNEVFKHFKISQL